MATQVPPRSSCKYLIWIGFVSTLGLAMIAAFEVYGGYDVAADAPHSPPILWLAHTVRVHSITAHATGIVLPQGFGSEAQVKAGASEYAEMCAQCHLAPSLERTEISQGLYPRAPELSKISDLPPEQEFWVIKHGIKMTGMPAWGLTHDDKIIWSIVAFLQKLPTLSADEYRNMTKDATEEHEVMGNMPDMKK